MLNDVSVESYNTKKNVYNPSITVKKQKKTVYL